MSRKSRSSHKSTACSRSRHCSLVALHLSQPWFHGGVSRKEAQRLIEKQGLVDGSVFSQESDCSGKPGHPYPWRWHLVCVAACSWSVRASSTASALSCLCVMSWRSNTTWWSLWASRLSVSEKVLLRSLTRLVSPLRSAKTEAGSTSP